MSISFKTVSLDSATEEIAKRIAQTVRRVNLIVETVPDILTTPGWTQFWDVVQSLPDETRIGFLTDHPLERETIEHIFSGGPLRLESYEFPLNTPLRFAAMLAFIRLSFWEKWQSVEGRVSTALDVARQSRDHTMAESLELFLEELRGRIRAPRIIDSHRDVHPTFEGGSTFSDSLNAYKEVTSGGIFDPAVSVTFDHPNFIWIGRPDMMNDVHKIDPHQGKWVLRLPEVCSVVRLARILAHDFNRGALTWAKFLPYAIPDVGTYFILYANEDNSGRRDRLTAAGVEAGGPAGNPAFFVSNDDCFEANALSDAIRAISRIITRQEIMDSAGNPARYREALQDLKRFRNAGISDIQLRMIRATLYPESEIQGDERLIFLTRGCLSTARTALEIFLPSLFDPTRQMVIFFTMAGTRRMWKETLKSPS